MNIAQFLERGATLVADKPAIIFEGREISYAELDQSSSRFANALIGLGIQPGDRVGLFLPNIPDFVVAYFGVQKAGATGVALNVMLTPPEARFILEDCEARALVTTEELRNNVPSDALPELEFYLVIGDGPEGGDYSVADLLEKASSETVSVDMQRDEPAVILYTSGTTGFPKGATLSHGNVISNCYSAMHNLGIRFDDRLQLFLPMFHCFGQNAVMVSAMAACATVVLQQRFTPDGALDAIAHDRVTMFFGVPTIFITYLNQGITLKQMESVRYFFTAAATMPKEISATWMDRFQQPMWEGYGLTETSPFSSYNHFLRHKLGSIGSPIENVEMCIVDADDNTLPDGEMGEICIKGANIMLGYWNRPDATAEAIRSGWFHSGDVGYRDDEGYYFICDRIKDMVITAGFNVYPVEIENVIHGHPAIAEVAVYGMPDDIKGEAVAATVVVGEGHELTEEALIEFCREKLSNYKVPTRVEFADSIPKGATGKVLKRVLRHDEVKPE